MLVTLALSAVVLYLPLSWWNFWGRVHFPSKERKQAMGNQTLAAFEEMAQVLRREAHREENLELARRNLDLPMYWVNLDRSLDRRERMLETFERLGPRVQAKRVPAFDGASLDEIDIRMLKGRRTATEVACLRSHVRALDTMLRDGHEMAVIMEDDVSLDAAHLWPQRLSEIVATAPDDWTAIQLYSNKVVWDAVGIGTDGDRVRAVGGKVYGAVAFVIRASWARTVMRIKNNFERRYTSESGLLFLEGTHTYHVEPSLVWAANSELGSTLHEEETPVHLFRAAQVMRVWHAKQQRMLRSNSSWW